IWDAARPHWPRGLITCEQKAHHPGHRQRRSRRVLRCHRLARHKTSRRKPCHPMFVLSLGHVAAARSDVLGLVRAPLSLRRYWELGFPDRIKIRSQRALTGRQHNNIVVLMIPALVQVKGVPYGILPPGIHRADLRELEERFAANQRRLWLL